MLHWLKQNTKHFREASPAGEWALLSPEHRRQPFLGDLGGSALADGLSQALDTCALKVRREKVEGGEPPSRPGSLLIIPSPFPLSAKDIIGSNGDGS